MDMISSDINIEDKNKGKVVFKVRRVDFYDDLLKEQDKMIKNEENETENDSESFIEIKGNGEHSSSNRISAYSKVNFSKLNPEEKDLRLKNLAKIVKHLRKKIRSYETKNEENQKSLIGKNEKGLKAAQKKLISNVIKAQSLLKSHMKNEKEKNFIDLFFELVANNKMKLDSSYFKKIIEQIEKCAKETQNEHKTNAKREEDSKQKLSFLNIYQDKSKPLIINFNNNNPISSEYKYYPSNIYNENSQNFFEQYNKQYALYELYKQSLFFNYNYSMNSYNNNMM